MLPYSVSLQALSVNTTNTTNAINGSAPYFTFDGGRTKATTTDSLLGITLSDGTTITPSTNFSTIINPIVLPNVNETFTDVGMLMPVTRNSIPLSSLVNARYNYWGDDDGDGQGARGVTATGRLTVEIRDKNNQTVARNDTLDICNAPYKLVLRNTNGSLSTRYGVPNRSIFTADTVTYYINPTLSAKVCYAKPGLQEGVGRFAGPADMWDTRKGFISQSTSSDSYNLNFPTVGANGLYFDLDIGGSGLLTWAPVTQGGITANMTPNASGTSVRVMLTGPAATNDEQSNDLPGRLQAGIPVLPQIFELEGKDSRGRTVVKYGFVLQKWFVNRGLRTAKAANITAWCASLGYRMIKVNDVTNAVCGNNSYCQGSVGATPPSSGSYYQRRINAGLFSEWGRMSNYSGAGFSNFAYWTSDVTSSSVFYVYSYNGRVYKGNPATGNYHGLCVYP
ncbi:hypothetical protein GA0061081_11253 [Gilliamella bombicola]|uniref:Uncharacterized protein n=1 Tax=Gilliamella bombicola TaxID=1798182 RepID=A0A1C4D1E7_9GAMM|nr:hypothetical protein [Gilliamella bombicola]SCC25111.1 hypothetical protein GA0061081_11253 [Gilliamella bombicola]